MRMAAAAARHAAAAIIAAMLCGLTGRRLDWSTPTQTRRTQTFWIDSMIHSIHSGSQAGFAGLLLCPPILCS